MEEENGRRNMKVMVVIDESECSCNALMWVLNNLKESIKNLPLVIFVAQPVPNCNYVVSAVVGFARMYSPLSATPDLIKSAQARTKKISLGLLEKAQKICASEGVSVEAITEIGDPKETICKVVQKYNVDLLVVGDQANGIKRAFPGGIVDGTRNAKCSVLVVKKIRLKVPTLTL